MKYKVILGIILIVIAGYFLYGKISNQIDSEKPTQDSKPTQISSTDKPQIVKTVPDPLNEAIVPANQVVEITFNRPLENVGEFKIRMEPKIEFKLELSGDRKTGKIIPAKPFELGTEYTIYLGAETKFDGVGRWGENKEFRFRTIKYRGI